MSGTCMQAEECLSKTAETMRLLSKQPPEDPCFLLLTGAVMEQTALELLAMRPTGFLPAHSHKLGVSQSRCACATHRVHAHIECMHISFPMWLCVHPSTHARTHAHIHAHIHAHTRLGCKWLQATIFFCIHHQSRLQRSGS